VETIAAGEAVARVLRAEGVRHVFGLPGGHVLAIYDALYDAPGIDHILVRHEHAAASGASQEIATERVFAPVTNSSVRGERVEQIVDVLRRAFATARSSRPGPVLVDLPRDLLDAELPVTVAPERVSGTLEHFTYYPAPSTVGALT